MKIRIHAKKKIKLETLLMHIAVFCVVSFALLEHASISLPIVSLLKMPLMYAGGVCILTQAAFIGKFWKKKRYFYIFVLLLMMCALLLVSAYSNRNTNIGVSPLRNTVRLILYLLEMFLLMVWLAETGRGQFFLDYLFYYVLILTVITDILLFTGIMQRFTGSKDAYLVGTKFTVSYFHMNLLTLWFVRNKERLLYSDRKAKRVLLWSAPVVLLVTIYIDCITGILGCLILLVLFLLLNTKFQKKLMRLNSPVLLVICLTISLIFPFIADWFTSLPAVLYLLKNIFDRDISLTGRLNIFALFGSEMQGHWLWGFGFGNGNAAAVKLFGYANSQNALLHWILQSGVPVTVLLVLLMILIIRQLSKVSDRMRRMPFVVLIYVYVIIGCIETTFSMSFLLWLGVIFLLNNERPAPVQSLKE